MSFLRSFLKTKKAVCAVIAVALLVLLLRACSSDGDGVVSNVQPSPVVVQPQTSLAPQPVIVQSQPQPVVVHDRGDSGFLSGMLMGHLMSGGGHGYHSHTTVVHHYSTPRYTAPKRYYGSRSRSYSARTVTRSRTTYRSYGRRR